jgi:hypothetical protein
VPLTGAELLAAISCPSRLHPDDAAAWADLNSDAHHTIQDAARYQPLGWREDQVWISADDGSDVELHLGQLVDELDRAITEQTLPAEAVVYRGTDLAWLLAQAHCETASDLPGRVCVESGYLSTTANPKVAALWSKSAMIELRLPAGTPVLSLPALGYQEQAELLLARGSEMTIDSVERGSDHWRIAAHLSEPHADNAR